MFQKWVRERSGLGRLGLTKGLFSVGLCGVTAVGSSGLWPVWLCRGAAARLGFAEQELNGNVPFPYGVVHGKGPYRNHQLFSLPGGVSGLASNTYLEGWGRESCCSNKLQRFGLFIYFFKKFQITIQEWFVH